MAVTAGQLAPQEVQLWQASLQRDAATVQIFETLLSEDELKRAKRFLSPVHQRRFIVARGILRTLLGRYLVCEPRALKFLYAEHGKPYIEDTDLNFNVSHSDEMAVYAFTRQAEIGVDIEKVETVFKAALAKRFFSNDEYEMLTALFGDQQERGFYRVWARKEAIIKGLGEGLHIPLDSFSVSLEVMQQLKFSENIWHLQSFTVDPAYEAAFALSTPPKKISQMIFE
ncbi:MAG: 4'-phosphopantetheinyl transferase superfamily protein [Pseudomonadota bacterium]